MVVNYTFKLFDPNFKGAVQVINELLHYQVAATNGTFLKQILKKRVHLEIITLSFTAFSPLLPVFDEKIQQLLAGGIIERYRKDSEENLDPKRYEHLIHTGPKVLTMNHLAGGFMVWIGFVLLSVIVFIGEIVTKKIKEMTSREELTKKMKGSLVNSRNQIKLGVRKCERRKSKVETTKGPLR